MRRTWNFPARAVPPTPAADGRPATAASQHVDRGLRALSAGSGEAALAAFDAALALTPADAEVISLRALALAMVGRWEEAETEAGRAIQLEPHERAFQGNLAQILERRGPAETSQAAARRDWPALEAAARRWAARRPDRPAPWQELARARFDLGDPAAAAQAYRRAAALQPRSADALATLGGLLLHALAHEEAGRLLDEALESDPGHVSARTSRATLLTYLGRFEEAERDCRRALEGDPRHAPAYTLLTRLAPDRIDATARATLEDVADDEASPLDHRIPAAFALGHVADRQGRIGDAFAAYYRAHDLAAARDAIEGRSYDHARAEARARAIAGLPIKPPQTGATATPRPLFILGMARSGTTLIEAVLASHPKVFGAGERTAMAPLLEAWLSGRSPEAPWAAAYLRGLGDLAGFTHVTDKAPRNLEAVGLIHRLFPDAPIVLVRRDPVETCLSLYRQEFSRDWPFAHDLISLARGYALSARMASMWRERLPGRIIEVQYETFAADFGAEARRLVTACGLDWDTACLEPHRSPRPIATFSTVTARSPVRVMNDRASAYRAHLAPLVETLEAEGVDLETGGLRAGVDHGLK